MAQTRSPESTRLTNAELRRRLLAPPPSDTQVPAAEPAVSTASHTRRGNAIAPAPVDPISEIEAVAARQFGGSTRLRGEPAGLGHLDVETRDAPPSFDLNTPSDASLSDDVLQLRSENEELRQVLQETRQILEEASGQEQVWQDREREYVEQLEEKTRQLDELNEQLRLIEEQVTSHAPTPQKNEDELAVWADELERESARLTQERKRLDEERRQLRDDEETLERQMREMEVSMARERAMMARQETELKRLSSEIQHELELMQRGDAGLREQMVKFQRRHQEVLARSAGMPVPAPAPVPAAPAPTPAAPVAAPKRDSGLFKRFFGAKGK